MRKLRVGVWINEAYKPEYGGGFGYYTQLIGKLKSHSFADTEIRFITNREVSNDLNCYCIQWTPIRGKKIRKILNSILNHIPFVNFDFDKQEKDHLKKLHRELNSVVDLIYYPTPECVYPDFPFIYTLWDSGHLSTFGFPEVMLGGQFEERKKHYDEALYKAQMIFAESVAGKNEIEYFFRINPSRIHVVPIFPSQLVEASFGSTMPAQIDEKTFFIHYPAQFWAHKNHYNLILAFQSILRSFPHLKLVFTGSDKGNKSYIFSIIKDLNLTEHILDLGFVSMEELKWLYQHSQGLVMPTFLGPTNMPLLEAAELGCPVACSDHEGQREQLGDYGYYFDPSEPKQIADAVTKMLIDKQSGIRKTYLKKFSIEQAITAIDSGFAKIRSIRFTWN